MTRILKKRSDGDLVEQGFVFSLVPPSSAKLYDLGIKAAVQDLAIPQSKSSQIRSESCLEIQQGNLSEEVWSRLQRAEIVVADLSGYNPQVICTVGMALALKDPKNLILLRGDDRADEVADMPQELQNFSTLVYSEDDWVAFSSELQHRLRETLREGPAPHPLPKLEHKQMMESAEKYMREKNWPTAELWLRELDRELPANWYVLVQWGVLHRMQGDLHGAQNRLDEAANLAVFNEHKAMVFTELAKLEAEKKNTAKAEELFDRARSSNPGNRQIYIAWAELYDGLGSPNKALAQITKLMDVVGKNDKDAVTRTEYYTRKLTQPGFSISYEEFEKITTSPGQKHKRAEGRGGRPPSISGSRKVRMVPKHITWPAFRSRFEGALVEGEVNNTNPNMGVFVYLNPEIKGLIRRSKAGPDFRERFKSGQKIRVRIRGIYIKNGKRNTDLELA